MGRLRVFVMTDVVGSTKLWDEHPEAMPEALARHDHLIQSAMTAHDGTVFKHTGDGMIAAFDAAEAAVSASLAAVAALADADWPTTGPLRIRCSIHAGAATERDGDFFGSPINRLARINGLAQPDQVLGSDTVHSLLNRPRGLDLGEAALRDVAGPVRIWQFDDGDHAPLRSLSRARSSLPSMPTEFIGRRDELNDLRQLVRRHRLTSVVGVGGCGKTRLAIETAAEVASHFAGGIWFADLTPENDLDGVTAAITRGMELAGQLGDSELADACALAFTEPTLLVLDNCEHVIDDAADMAEELLAAVDDLAILATSREALNVPGEHIWQIPDLGRDAEELFTARAEAAGVTPDDDELVTLLCDQLDRIPLALELAAAQLRSIPLRSLASMLDDRFAVLDGGRHRRRRRQQTLKAMVDWSYELLDDTEQRLLAELCVFHGNFSVRAAEAVSTVESAAGALRSLVEQSLVSIDPVTGRCRLLETIRLYGLDLLVAQGRLDEMRDRHLEWCLEIGGISRRPDLAPGLLQQGYDIEQRTEVPNIYGALDWAWVNGRTDHVRDLVHGSVVWLVLDPTAARKWTLRCPPPTTPIESLRQMSAEIMTSYALEALYDPAQVEPAAALVDRLDDGDVRNHQDAIRFVLLFQANMSGILGDTDRELRLCERMAELVDRVGDVPDIEFVRWQMTADAYMRRNDPRAIDAIRASLDVAQRGRLAALVLSQMFAAQVFYHFGHYDEAVQYGMATLESEGQLLTSFRRDQVFPLAVSLVELGRLDDAVDVLAYDLGPMIPLVQRSLRAARMLGFAWLLDHLGQTELVPALVGAGIDDQPAEHRDAPAFVVQRLVGGLAQLDELVDRAASLNDGDRDALLDAARTAAAESIAARGM